MPESKKPDTGHDDDVPELDDIVDPDGAAQEPPNLDLFAPATPVLDKDALRGALRGELDEWLEQELPGTLARLEDTLLEYLRRRLEASLPEMLDRIINQLDKQDAK